MPYVSSLKRILTYHTRAINTLKFSQDCSKLSSAGDDAAVVVWDLKSANAYQVIKVPLHGPVSAITWIHHRTSEALAAFVFGSADGTLFLCEQSVTYPHEFHISKTQHSFDGPIEDVAFDADHRRLVSVSIQGVKVFEFDEKGEVFHHPEPGRTQSTLGFFVEIASEASEDGFLPRGVVFIEEGRKLIIGYMETHELRTYNVNPWSFERSTRLAAQMLEAAHFESIYDADPVSRGHMTIAPDGRALAVASIEKGLELFTLPLEKAPVQTAAMSFARRVTHRGIPFLISVDEQVIVGGTDNGVIEVFNRTHNSPPHTLEHWKQGTRSILGRFRSKLHDPAQRLVQTTAVQKKGRTYLVAAGTGSTGNMELTKAQISLWSVEIKEMSARRARVFVLMQVFIALVFALLIPALVSARRSQTGAVYEFTFTLDAVAGVFLSLGWRSNDRAAVESVPRVAEVKARNFWGGIKWSKS
ncbi:hypothetical protein NP233_g769 [Leucocoprinus birnbaumii]|uniref:WD40 repeat-like protein n=1 Tax=Leucocoprinus birnbaumii TaxID=56174 RepID=A0AAD5W1M4_9AGAR|nr:hypothetical protein NP233_g769 [Leucocoprinus birnbaumii]